MHTQDPYWSRHDGHSVLAERLDPVCWGGSEGPLSDEDLAAFERDGFLIRPALLSPEEVDLLLADAESLKETPGLREQEHVITEPTSRAIRSIFRVHETDSSLGELARDARFRDVARQILGSEVRVHQSRINFKPGLEGKEFYWHSDFETWHMEDGMPRMRALSASVLLTENTSVNGPLMLVPGSHKTYVRCPGETPEDHYKHSLKKQEYGVPDPDAMTKLVEDGGIVEATGPAGTVVFFDCNVMHGSSGNLSPYPRHNVFMVFNSVENTLQDPFAGTPPRPGFLGER